MADESEAPTSKRNALRDVSGTTLALTSLAVMGVAAVVSAPVWYWYRRKRKRTDALVSQAPPDTPAVTAAAAPVPPGAAPEPAEEDRPSQ